MQNKQGSHRLQTPPYVATCGVTLSTHHFLVAIYGHYVIKHDVINIQHAH